MDYLCELPNDAARRKALDCLPPDLNSTYERILGRINQSNPETQKLARRALRWIANASTLHSFTTRALCEAVSVDFGSTKRNPEAIPDEFEILHWCSSLVRKSANGEKLELAHFTVKEYLQQIDPRRDLSISAYRIHPETDKIALTEACLTYLNFEDFEQGVLPDLDMIKHRLREYPFRKSAIEWSIEFLENRDSESDGVNHNGIVSLAQKLWSPSKPNTFITWMYDYTATVYGKWPEDEEKLSVIKAGFAETTALHWMAMLGFGSMCSWLIDSGCDINRSSAFGTPLHCALSGVFAYRYSFSPFEEDSYLVVDYPFGDVVDPLLKAGAEINCYYESGPDKLSTLFISFVHGNRDIVMRLLDEGGILDDRCLDLLEDNLEDGEICDIVNHANEDNVEPGRYVRLLELALKAGTSDARGLISNGDGLPIDSAHYEQILRTAAELGQVEIVKCLLENQKLDVDAPEEVTGLTGLHNAARTDQLEVTQTLMDSGADLSRSDCQGRTALHHSLHGRDLSCLQYFLSKDANTGLRSLDSMTVWHLAAQDGNVEALKVLLSRPEDSMSAIDLKTKDGRTPLLFASASTSKEAVSLLLDAGSSLTETASDGSSSLHYAVKSGSLEVVSFLIEKAVDPCAVTKDGSNTIHYAVRWPGGKTAEIVSLLLEQGVDPRKTNDEERTPLQDLVRIVKEGSLSPDGLDWLFAAGRVLLKSLLEKSRIASDIKWGSELVYLACLYSHGFPSAEETVSALLGFGLDVNIQFDDGKTALMAAAQCGNGAIFSNLIRHGADPGINTSGLNALMSACFEGHKDIVIRLRGTEIDWNCKTKAAFRGVQQTEVTALHLVAAGHTGILEYLLNEELVSNVNARTDFGETPLFWAASAGAYRNVSILLSNNSDSNCIDTVGDSAAHAAAENGYSDVISEFMRHGSDLGFPNSSGLTPELLARKMGHEVLAETIMNYVNEQSRSRLSPDTFGCIDLFRALTDNDPNDSHNPRTSHDTSEALTIAIDLGDLQLCTRLVEGGTNLDTGLECCMGCTPLLYALPCGQDAIAEYLVSKGASIAGNACELRSTRGFTVFHYAAIWYPELLRLLLEKAPTEIYVIYDPIHPIHLAVFRGDTDCLKLILDHASRGRNMSSDTDSIHVN